MGMAGERHREAIGHAREDVRLMRQQDRRRIVGDGGQRRIEVVGPRDAAAAAAIGPLAAEAGEPDRPPAMRQPPHLVVHDRQAGGGEFLGRARQVAGAALRLPAFPPVMVAEHRMHAERRPRARKHLGDHAEARPVGDEAMIGEVVAEQHDEIGLERIGERDRARQPRQRGLRPAGMWIGEDRDAQRQVLGPVRRCDPVPHHAQPGARLVVERKAAGHPLHRAPPELARRLARGAQPRADSGLACLRPEGRHITVHALPQTKP